MKNLLTILISLSLCVPSLALAHIGGNAIEDGEYRIELGSFPEDGLNPNETIIFSAVMEDLEANPVFNSKAWIRISQNDEILFSSSDFITEDGTVDFEYLFADHGMYDMTIRMINTKNDDEATVTFPLEIGDPNLAVEGGQVKQFAQSGSRFNLSVLTLIIGLLSGVFLARYRPKSSKVG